MLFVVTLLHVVQMVPISDLQEPTNPTQPVCNTRHCDTTILRYTILSTTTPPTNHNLCPVLTHHHHPQQLSTATRQHANTTTPIAATWRWWCECPSSPLCTALARAALTARLLFGSFSLSRTWQSIKGGVKSNQSNQYHQ